MRVAFKIYLERQQRNYSNQFDTGRSPESLGLTQVIKPYVSYFLSLSSRIATDDSRLTTLVYKANGIISESRPSDKLVEVLEEHFGEAKIELVKSNELAITASEQIHYKISKFLAQLNDD